MFWERRDPQRRRAALNSAIWRIQKLLVTLPGIRLQPDTDHLRLMIDADISIDADELSCRVNGAVNIDGIDAFHAAALSASVEACKTPFLDGLSDYWTLTERERLANVQIRGMAILMRWHGSQGHFEQALEFGRQLLAIDPFREAILGELMWLYVMNGQRARALTHFEDYRILLREELGIAPMPETCALHRHIKFDMDGDPGQSLSASPTQPGRSGSSSLSQMLEAIEASRRATYTALSALPQHAL